MRDVPIASTRPTGKEGGFSLVELVVVMAIMTLLVGVGVPALVGLLDSSFRESTEEEMHAINEAVITYTTDTGRLPRNLDDLYQDTVVGWGGPYIDDPNGGADIDGEGYRHDAWGSDYRYRRNGSTRATLESRGPDGRRNTADDISVQIDVTRVLRELTKRELDIINNAILRHNAVHLPDNPLPSGSNQLIATLQSRGYLPAGTEWRLDAFGDRWQPSGNPVSYVRSSNFGQ